MHFKKINTAVTVAAFMMIQAAFAAHETGLGSVARNMLEPVYVLSDFVSATCFIIGSGFIFASIIKYIEHRRSPLMVPISTVIFLFIAGLLLIGLPFMWMLSVYVNK